MDNHSTKPVENEAYAFPASFAQQRLWFLHRLEPDSPAYNVSIAFRLSGPLNVPALKRSFQEIVSRHETLRTTFALLDGEAAQIVAPAVRMSLPVIDLRALPQVERDDEMRRVIEEESKRPFDLEKGPLLRLSLLQMADDEHALNIHMHHIISDGWSLPILFRELTEIYGAYSKDSRPTLPELPIQYADYAIWQRDCFAEGKLESQVAYWKKQLSDIPVLQLPSDRPRRDGQSQRGARRAVLLPAALSDRLRSLSRQEGATLFMTVLAAFQVFLHRYSGQQDIAVGTPIAGRTRPEIEKLIGFFVNTLVIRTDFSDDPSFRQLLARVRSTALDAYDNQDLPFEKLVQEINPDRSLGSTPLFQAMFSLQTASEGWQLPGVQVSPLNALSEIAKFDFSASITEKENSLRVSFSYKSDLFDGATIERWLCHFESILASVVEHPDRRLSELSFLSESDEQQLLVDWNNTAKDYPRDCCIHALFEAQVERTPDAVALVFNDQQLTYKELNRRANQLARHLKDVGVQPDNLVGICLESSFEMIVALLGVLKAGGAYAPLDPSFPKERLGFMLEDAGSAILITQESLLDRLPKQKVRPICMDRDWATIARQSESNLGVESSAECLAYVIYTSGSTGKPKGVAVSQRAVNRLVINTDYIQIASVDVVAQGANITFDAATFEIWGALLNGARLVLLPKATVLSPPAMSTAIERYGVTTLFLTTALFNLLVDEVPHALGKLRHLLFGGEAADAERVRRLLAEAPPRHLLHVYGPTESTTFASSYEIRNLAPDAVTVPIGRPIANTEIYILDPYLNPVPIGVAGEIYIGGAGVARGYLNRPELTAEKFVCNPFNCDPGSKLYRTGDRARYSLDGNMEFLGRLDNQVKVRGYRIELGEIEAVLVRHSGVRECVVVTRQDDATEKSLIAYVVEVKDSHPASHDLRAFLTERLPEYMVPATFVFLASLPLTPNGKVDRRALPMPELEQRVDQSGYGAPRAALEQVLAEIWAEVLRLERVGIHDNFFDLGGHSLMGIRLIAQVCKELKIDLPLRRLFECPTVAKLADSLGGDLSRAAADRRANSPWRYLIELKPGRGGQPVFFLPGGLGGDYEFLVYARLTHFVSDDYAFYGLRARSADGSELAHPNVEQMAADYVQEMRILQPQGPYFIVGNCIGGIVAYEIAQQLRSLGQKIALLALMDTRCPSSERYRRYRRNLLRDRLRRRTHHVLEVVRKNYYVARLPFHWQRFWETDWRQRLRYILRKTGVAITDSARTCSKPIESRHRLKSWNEMKRAQIQEGYINALQRYHPRPYFGRAVMLVNEKISDGDPTLGWSDLVVNGIDVRRIPGDHEAYIRQYVQTAAAELRECLRCASVSKPVRDADASV